MQEKLLEIRDISKYYPGVTALKGVSFDIRRGSVHCIVGENGAGKSTLIKILTGAERRSEGTIRFNGREFNPHGTRDAMRSGMSVLFQELNVVNQLTVQDNLSLGKEKRKLGFFKRDPELIGNIYEVLRSLDPSISLTQMVEDLSVAQKQVIEIAKAIASDSNVIIMDEPTAAISDEEVNRLFQIIRKLKTRDVTVVYISHRLSEIFEIGDYVTVLRDGRMIDTKAIADFAGYCKDDAPSASSSMDAACDELIRMMLGKVVAERYIPSDVDRGAKVLELRSVSNGKLKDVSFALYKGEILGFYGLVGSGKTEIAKAIYGIDGREGEVLVGGKLAAIANPADAIGEGIAMVPEERRSEGLFTNLTIRENIPMMNLRTISKNGVFSRKRERLLARRYIEKVRIVARDEDQRVSELSGGNQQKVVLSKCLNAESDIILMDEPTRGIDVGAKEEIHNLIRELAKNGKSVIVFTSELPEVLNLCDRIILLYDGKIMRTLENGRNIDHGSVMKVVTGAGV
jgi:ABC-type sugar transport system ATPase subunit